MMGCTTRQQAGALLAVLVVAAAVSGAQAEPPRWEPALRQFAARAKAAVQAAAATVTARVPASRPALAPAAAIFMDNNKQHAAGKGPALPRTTGKQETQAGCSCLESWSAESGGAKLSGCANPDNDPMGAWCPVNPGECFGYYSMYRTEAGHLQYYDYCGQVRERTTKGCLCSAYWNLGDLVGKSMYRDGCARPNSPSAKRTCRVDQGTCPEGADVDEFDVCEERKEPMVVPATTTWYKCACVGSWSYRYSDGNQATFSSCANPDGDPLGPWCEVDPETCDSFVSVVKGGKQRVSIGYCNSQFKQPEPQSCSTRLRLHDQCGGKSNCTGTGCVNAPWPGACCPRGSECRRNDAFYYQCTPLPSAAAGAGGSGSGASVHKAAYPPAAAAVLRPEIAAASSDSADDNEEDGDDEQLGKRVWARLKLAMDYDTLMAAPEQLSHFKGDVSVWLRSAVGQEAYVTGTGVETISRGSVIALCYVDFAPHTPQAAVDAAVQQLASNAHSLYDSSPLSITWGWLVALSTAKSREEMEALALAGPTTTAPGDSLGPLPIVTTRRRGPRIPMGAAIAVAVCGALLLLAAVCAVVRRSRGAPSEAADSCASEGGAARSTDGGGLALKKGSFPGGLESGAPPAEYDTILANKGHMGGGQVDKHGAFWITNIASSSHKGVPHGAARLSSEGGGRGGYDGMSFITTTLTDECSLAPSESEGSSDGGEAPRAPPPSPRVTGVFAPSSPATAAAAIAAAASPQPAPGAAAAAAAATGPPAAGGGAGSQQQQQQAQQQAALRTRQELLESRDGGILMLPLGSATAAATAPLPLPLPPSSPVRPNPFAAAAQRYAPGGIRITPRGAHLDNSSNLSQPGTPSSTVAVVATSRGGTWDLGLTGDLSINVNDFPMTASQPGAAAGGGGGAGAGGAGAAGGVPPGLPLPLAAPQLGAQAANADGAGDDDGNAAARGLVTSVGARGHAFLAQPSVAARAHAPGAAAAAAAMAAAAPHPGCVAPSAGCSTNGCAMTASAEASVGRQTDEVFHECGDGAYAPCLEAAAGVPLASTPAGKAALEQLMGPAYVAQQQQQQQQQQHRRC